MGAIESMYGIVSAPVEAVEHEGCGWHGTEFSTDQGRFEFQQEVNVFLGDFRDGYWLSDDGHVRPLTERPSA